MNDGHPAPADCNNGLSFYNSDQQFGLDVDSGNIVT